MQPTDDLTQLRYSPSNAPDVADLESFGSLANIGAVVLEGDPEGWVRFDYTSEHCNAGIFMASAGTVRYTFPSTEHATILEGSATFTDEQGRSETYGPGDTYFVPQGTVMVCMCPVRTVKSFMNYATPAS